MPRNRKGGNGLSYFPLDTDFFDNHRIRNLQRTWGHEGVALLLRLYCEAYRDDGYFVLLDEDALDFLSADIGVGTDRITEMLNYFSDRSILTVLPITAEPGGAEDILVTGENVQRQFQESVKRMASSQKKTVDPNIWILDPEDTLPCVALSVKSDFPGFGPLNPRNAALAKSLAESRIEAKTAEVFEKTVAEPGGNAETGGEKEKKKEDSSALFGKPDEPEPKPEKEKARPKGKKAHKPAANSYIAVKDFESKKVYGEFGNVWLKQQEVDRIHNRYPGLFDRIIEILGNYKASSGKGYQSDYAAINSWVAERAMEDYAKSPSKTETDPSRVAAVESFVQESMNESYAELAAELASEGLKV